MIEAALALALQGAAPAGPADLSWLSGQWRQRKGDTITEEFWSCPRGGMLFGVGTTVRGGRLVSWERMIVRRGPDGRLTFHAAPANQAPVTFNATVDEPGRLLFSSSENDFPKAVSYARQGEALAASISAEPDGSPAAQSWRYERVAALNCD
jgi:hypothetical protein